MAAVVAAATSLLTRALHTSALPLAVGGVRPRLVHLVKDKPFRGPQPGASGHQFLCGLNELHRRSLMAGLEPGPPQPAADSAVQSDGAADTQQQQQPWSQEEEEEPRQQQQTARDKAQQEAGLAPAATNGT